MATDTHTHRAHSRARRAPRMRRRRILHTQGKLRFASGIVLMIALVTAGFGVEAYMRAARSEHRVAALQADLASLQQRVSADERTAAGDRRHVRSVAAHAAAAERTVSKFGWKLQSLPSEAQLAGLRNDVANYAACIPQLQNEIDGLRLNLKINAAKPTTDSFRLFTATPASPSC
jgi:hypothetical protein